MPTMTPANADFLDEAPMSVVTTVSLRQTPSEVWAVLVDNERWPEWFGSCKAARTTSDPGTGVGATRWAHVDLFKVNERFIVWDEPHQWGFTILDANLPIADTVVEIVTLEPEGEGTRLTYRFGIQLKPLLRPLTPVFRRKFTRLFEKSLAGLQPHLDAIGPESA